MSIKTELRAEFTSEIQELHKAEFGSEKQKVGAAIVTGLADRIIELDKIDLERDRLEVERQKLDVEYQKNEIDLQDKKTRNRVSMWGVALPAGIAVIGGIAMFIYEERGSITSTAGRKLLDKYIFRVK